MRAGPLSSPRVIELLNRHFVPVYVSNEDYRNPGLVPERERAEYYRIYHETLRAKLSAGTVHVYLLAPDGRVLDSLHVAAAAVEPTLVAALERTSRHLGVQPGEPLVPPSPQSALLVQSHPGSLLIHLTARYGRKGGDWFALPSENWVVLRPEHWRALLPGSPPSPGQTWTIPPVASAEILTHCYPPTENNDTTPARLLEQGLTGTVTAVQDGVARARLEGRVAMRHMFYPGRQDSAQPLQATLVGYVEFEVDPPRVLALRLVADRAIYGRELFNVAIRSVP